ncbi:hypothetical protein [Synechococcus sp. LTW-R]|uniref:hypothetical protein n=1 Tax=Synechococcus sp. LTW-R TaxID=2751170 RepID=UPI00162A5ED3|nr:hypothetical protein [Synechococcus sp. LTW-R]QNG29602.1 hypothetical protein H0O22_13075 [Synechococcus sp. LTW-R]
MRFNESGSHSLRNEWLEFSRLHSLGFWEKKIMYSRVPGASCNQIRRALFRENGFEIAGQDQALQQNDHIFAIELKELYKYRCNSFAVIQHPAKRLAMIPAHLKSNRDGCADTWNQMTGRQWDSLSMMELARMLASRKDLSVASHWWCPQETCLIFKPESYTNIFKEGSLDKLAWWLGERGVQMETIQNGESMVPNIRELDSKKELKDKKLDSIENFVSDNKFASAIMDAELYEIAQALFEDDARIYAAAI